MKTTPVKRFTPEKGLTTEISPENADLLFEESNDMLESLREDRRMIQVKTHFLLVIIGASILFGFSAFKDLKNLRWEALAFLVIELPILAILGACIINKCLLPKNWMCEGAEPRLWMTRRFALLNQKQLKCMMICNNQARIDFNSEENVTIVDSLIKFSMIAFLSPVIVLGVVGVVSAIIHLCSQ